MMLYQYVMVELANWASEASPTLGCSIEILCDICMSVCLRLSAKTKRTDAGD